MLNKKAFTLTELMTTVAITTVVFWWAAAWISTISWWSEILSWEQIFTSKIRSEKVSAISWEINCSKTNLFYWKKFFETFHWTEKNFSCNKKFFWNFSENNWKIFINFSQNIKNLEIQISANWWSEIYPDKISDRQISFDLWDNSSYKITAQKWEEIEEVELIFFNKNPWKLEENDPKNIFIWKILWKNFKKEKISWDKLSVVFVNSNPSSKIFLRWEEVNDAEIHLKTVNWDNSIFNFFSASLFWKSKWIDILEALK